MALIGNVALLVLVISASAVQAIQQPTLKEYYEDKDNKAAAAAASAAVKKKTGAINKVIDMMKSLKEKSIADGKAEAKAYEKFVFFCEDTQKEKGDSIAKGTTRKNTLAATIGSLTSERDTLVDTTIKGLKSNLEESESDMKKKTSERAATNSVYTKSEKDVSAAIESLKNAIQVLKASKKSAASLVQVHSISKTLKTAMLLADALGIIRSEDKEVTALLQSADDQPEQEMENYKFKSSGIVATLEKLLKQFTDTKNLLDKDEVQSVQTYEMALQTFADEKKALEVEMSSAQAQLDDKTNAIGQNSEELNVVSSMLVEDKKSLEELVGLCNDKGTTYDQRTKLRSEELEMLTTVIGVLESSVKTKVSSNTVRLAQKGPGQIIFGAYNAQNIARNEKAMQALEASAEAEEMQNGPAGFLQLRQVKKHNKSAAILAQGKNQKHDPKKSARDVVSSMLKSEAVKLRSTALTALASRIQSSDDPFKKIRDMIESYLDKLLAEQFSEASSKNTCDSDIAEATWKRDEAADKVMAANANLASLEAKRDSLADQVEHLENEILEAYKEKNETTAARSEDSEANAATIAEAKEGLEAIESAIEIMSKFYGTSANAVVSLNVSLTQQGAKGDAPDAGFDNGEAYQGAQAEAGGIIGMMDVVKGDFKRTISKAIQDEADAKAKYVEFQKMSNSAVLEKTLSKGAIKKLGEQAKTAIINEKDVLSDEMKILRSQVELLMTYHTKCIDTGMKYDDRVAIRAQEIEDLKKAMCILDNYMEYGEDAEGAKPC